MTAKKKFHSKAKKGSEPLIWRSW